VDHAVVLSAEPSHVERFRVVVVVCFDFRRAADLTWLFEKTSISQCVVNSPSCAMSIRMPALALAYHRGAFRVVTFLIVEAVVLSVLCAMLLHVFASADATLIEVTISHLRMTVELFQWQNASALEATFHVRSKRQV
jgi:hypothetical protein